MEFLKKENNENSNFTYSEDWRNHMCGVAAVYGHRYAASMVWNMLFAQQHRGQESCGISVPGRAVKKGLGLVSEIFPDSHVSDGLPGGQAIGHVRYATQGTVDLDHAAPFERRTSFGMVTLSHNGHIRNYDVLRSFLERKGISFNSTNDGELMLKLITWKAEQNGHDMVKAIRYAMKKVPRAFSIVMQTPEGMFAFCDRFGYRPLVIGKKGRTYFVASETCALDKCSAQYVRAVKPGEIVRINRHGLKSFQGYPSNGKRHCIFEPIYLSFPSSRVYDLDVWRFQTLMGERMAYLFRMKFAELCNEYGRENIIICPTPDTARNATLGFCRELRAMDLFEDGALIRSHYAGRTFINSGQIIRDQKVKLKFSFIRDKIRGKVVVLVEDSIVRGSTMKKIAKILKKLGAVAVVVVVYSPQIKGSCFMGIDTPTKKELVANWVGGPDKVAEYFGVEYVLHCSVQDLQSVVAIMGQGAKNFCFACMDLRYGFPVPAH